MKQQHNCSPEAAAGDANVDETDSDKRAKLVQAGAAIWHDKSESVNCCPYRTWVGKRTRPADENQPHYAWRVAGKL